MKDSTSPNPLLDLLDDLETLHRGMVDLEAMAHAAAEVLQHIPYLPRLPASSLHPELDQLAQARVQFGRLFALVAATADTAAETLQQADVLFQRLQALRDRLDTEDGHGSGRANEPLAPYAGRTRSLARGTRTSDGRPCWYPEELRRMA